MTMIFNSYLKGGNGLISAFKNSSSSIFSLNSVFAGRISAINVFSSSVTFPSTVNTSALATGMILSFPVSPNDFVISGNSLILNTAGIVATASGTGTVGWWAGFPSDTNATRQAMICDSIGLPGTNSVLTISSTSVTSGQAVTLCSFNLSFV